MSDGYRTNTMILTFNLFDSIGRYMVNYIKIKRNYISHLLFLRFIFIFSFPLLINIEREFEPVNLFNFF